MIKLKRKLSDVEEQDRIFESFNDNPNLNFPDSSKSWNHFDYSKQKRRRFHLDPEEAAQNKMMLNKFSHDFYSQYFPKGENLGLGSPQEFTHRYERPVKKDRETNLYTEEQVKRLLQERESQLRIEYEKIIQERLQEQFQNFTKFNQDYISKQFRTKNFDNYYIS